MKKFRIVAEWKVRAFVDVEAENEEEAEQKAYDTETKDFVKPEYVDDTFVIVESKEL